VGLSIGSKSADAPVVDAELSEEALTEQIALIGCEERAKPVVQADFFAPGLVRLLLVRAGLRHVGHDSEEEAAVTFVHLDRLLGRLNGYP